MDFTSLKEALEKKGYTVTCFDTKEEAAAYVDGALDGTSIGFGGSVTVKEMGLYDMLEKHNTVYWHNQIPEGRTGKEMLTGSYGAEYYITSVNAVTEDGQIVNIDNTGNRVGAMLYGHKKVYMIIGENKIAPDYDAALYRTRNVAAPKNAIRLNRKTPCAVKGDHCYDCSSPDRICRALVVFWEKPVGSDYEIILVHENLGY